MPLCLFEDDAVAHLRPLTNTRAAYDLRLGGRTLLDTARDAFPDANGLILHARSLVAGVTAQAHPEAIRTLPPGADVLFVNGRFVADGPVVDRLHRTVADAADAQAFIQDDTLVAAWVPDAANVLPGNVLNGDALTAEAMASLPATFVSEAPLIDRLWHLLDALHPALRRDFAHATGPYNILEDIYSRRDADVHPSAVGVRPEQIYLAPGARVKPGAILNAEDGPIYVGEDATVFEQAVVRGPCHVGPKAQIKGGADVDGTAVGTYCKVGGEVHNSVLHSLSNKGHAGYLGDSYVGRWCNLGADTNTSNLKNNYGTVSLYDAAAGSFADTGRQFVGLFMGDHAKCGINTMFNTGTVIGTFCNLYGSGFMPRRLPPFTWGSPSGGFTEYRLEKALEVAARVMARRDTPLTDTDRTLLRTLFEQTAAERDEAL